MATTTNRRKTKRAKETPATYKTRASPRARAAPKIRLKYSNGRLTTTRATTRIIETEHLYIHKVPGVVGGEPIIKGTRISVRDIVEWWQLGWSIKKILKAYPHIRLAQVCDALGYYDDHQEEIIAYIKENQALEDDD